MSLSLDFEYTNEGSGQGPSTSIPRRKRKQHEPVFKYIGPNFPEPVKHTIVPADRLIHNGTCYRLGDVVRVFSKSNKIYFGIVIEFWADQYTEKYATLQWLIPKTDISQDGYKFEYYKYTTGPVHPELINIRSIGFVMSATSYGASFDSPVFNTFGELAITFNTNLPT